MCFDFIRVIRIGNDTGEQSIWPPNAIYLVYIDNYNDDNEDDNNNDDDEQGDMVTGNVDSL